MKELFLYCIYGPRLLIIFLHHEQENFVTFMITKQIGSVFQEFKNNSTIKCISPLNKIRREVHPSMISIPRSDETNTKDYVLFLRGSEKKLEYHVIDKVSITKTNLEKICKILLRKLNEEDKCEYCGGDINPNTYNCNMCHSETKIHKLLSCNLNKFDTKKQKEIDKHSKEIKINLAIDICRKKLGEKNNIGGMSVKWR